MGKATREGDSPLGETVKQWAVSRVSAGTRNPQRRRGDHSPSLNTTWWPIVEQYCEGKVKRTPGGEWKRTWNLMFTSTQSTLRCDVVLFVERSGEFMYAARLSTEGAEPKGNRVWKAREVACMRPETGWPIHVQVEVAVKRNGGPNRPPLKSWRMRCG